MTFRYEKRLLFMK